MIRRKEVVFLEKVIPPERRPSLIRRADDATKEGRPVHQRRNPEPAPQTCPEGVVPASRRAVAKYSQRRPGGAACIQRKEASPQALLVRDEGLRLTPDFRLFKDWQLVEIRAGLDVCRSHPSLLG